MNPPSRFHLRWVLFAAAAATGVRAQTGAEPPIYGPWPQCVVGVVGAESPEVGEAPSPVKAPAAEGDAPIQAKPAPATATFTNAPERLAKAKQAESARLLGAPSPRGLVSDAAKSDARQTTPGSIARGLLSIGVVVIVIVAGAAGARFILRKTGGLASAVGPGGRSPAGVLEVLGRYPIGRGQNFILLKLDRRVLLLGQCQNGRLGGTTVSTLCELTDPEEVAAILVKSRENSGETLSTRFHDLFVREDRAAARLLPECAPPARRLTPGAFGAQSVKATALTPAHERSLRSASPSQSIRRRLDALRAGGSRA